MRRLILSACLALAASVPVFAAGGAGSEDHLTLWKLANFAILAGAAAYLWVTKGKPFFESRSIAIKKDIAEAAKLAEEADARLVGVEKRLAGLDSDIKALRDNARLQAEAETERMRRETRRKLANIRLQAEMDIDAAAKAARLELKTYAGHMATSLARRRIEERLTPETQNKLVDLFVDGLSTEEAQRPIDAAVV